MATPMKNPSGTPMILNRPAPAGMCTLVVVPFAWGIEIFWFVYSEAIAPVIAERTPRPTRLSQTSDQFAVGSSWANEATPGFVVTLIHFCQILPMPVGTGGPSGTAY